MGLALTSPSLRVLLRNENNIGFREGCEEEMRQVQDGISETSVRQVQDSPL